MNRNIDPIPFARPSIGEEEEKAVHSVLRSGWLTTAGEAKQFEEEFARYIGTSHALAVNSATAGLHLSLEALDVGPSDTVITTPYTFTATAEVARYLGARIEFADIEEESLTIDPKEVERLLESAERTSDTPNQVILPVHLGGHPCRMADLSELSRRYGAPMVEDSAHAFPVSHEGRYLGTFGATGVFSFYATKTITSGEGGMIITDNDATAARIRRMRLHGIDREVWNRYTDSKASWSYDVVAAGYKYNLSDIAAAIGRVQLSKSREFKKRRREIAERYMRAFSESDFLILPSSSSDHAWHLFILRIKTERLTIDRNRYVELLKEAGIGVSVHYIPLHLMSYYKKMYGFAPEDFPVSLRVYRSAFSLPIYPSLSDEEVDRVIGEVKRIGEAHYRSSYHGGYGRG